MKSQWTLALVVCAVCTSPNTPAQNSPSLPAQAVAADSGNAVPAERPPSGSSGLMVFIDPVTGKIREPLPGEVNELLQSRSQTPPPSALTVQSAPIALPGGGVGVVLDESFHSHVVVTRKPDGTTLMDCLPDSTSAAEAVKYGLSSGEILHKKEVLDVQ